jgi:hypothetical protein
MITTKDLSIEEYEAMQKFEGLLADYAYAQSEGGFADRVKARSDIKQAFILAMRMQPTKKDAE